MSSSMLAGERRWASARRGGMTVLGKVSVPKPLNLPSQRLENHGLDPNVEIVPKGTLSWGNRSSSSASNAWSSSIQSPTADGGTSSPSHLSARPSSSGSCTRPSTAGSDRTHEPTASAWTSNSRPSSASGTLASSQTSSTSLRPRSAETRPNSSQLSRFAEPVSESLVAWGPSSAAERLGVKSAKEDGFSLSSGDFPTLGSDRNDGVKNIELQDHGSHDHPRSASSRASGVDEKTTMSQDVADSEPINTWKRDGIRTAEDGIHPSREKWQGDPQQYYHSNVPPPHFDSWRGPPMNAPPGVWYRGPSGRPSFGAPVGPGGFPMEPFPYHRPQVVPVPLAGSQQVPPPGNGPRGPSPKNGDLYRTPMPDAYSRPAMPFRPGFYPGPMPFDNYYGPPMGYRNANDREIPYMGMAAGPPVFNRFPVPGAPEPTYSHGRADGRGSTGKTWLGKVEADHLEGNQGSFSIPLKNQKERDRMEEEENWESILPSSASQRGKDGLPVVSSRKTEWGADDDMEEDIFAKQTTPHEDASLNYEGHSSTTLKVMSLKDTGNVKALDENWIKKTEYYPPELLHQTPASERESTLPSTTKGSGLMQKIEGLNVKVRASDGRYDVQSTYNREKKRSGYQVAEAKINNSAVEANSNAESFERTSASADFVPVPREVIVPVGDKSSQPTAFVSRRTYHGGQGNFRGKGKFNSQDDDEMQKKFDVISTSNVEYSSDIHACGTDDNLNSGIYLVKDGGQSSAESYDSTDIQRAKMRETAKQRALQLQMEEEERTREQKAKALAKLEELNRRAQAVETGLQNTERTKGVGVIQGEQEESRALAGEVTADFKFQAPGPTQGSDSGAVSQHTDSAASHAGESANTSRDSHLETHPPSDLDHVLHHHSSPSKQDFHSAGTTIAFRSDDSKQDFHSAGTTIAFRSDDGSGFRHKRTGYKQKHNDPSQKNLNERSALNVTGAASKDLTDASVHDVIQAEVTSSVRAIDETNAPDTSDILADPSIQQRRKGNRNGKNKQRLDEAVGIPPTAPLTLEETNPTKESIEKGKSKALSSDLGGSDLPKIEPDGGEHTSEVHLSLHDEDAHGRISKQWKPQSRRMPRSVLANRVGDKYHSIDTVIWAPVRSQSKVEAVVEASQKSSAEASTPAKIDNLVQNNAKSKRAEMERYVPKPVAKELAQQGNIQPGSSTIPAPEEAAGKAQSQSTRSPSPLSNSSATGILEPGIDVKEGDGRPNKQGKAQGTWRQRNLAEPSNRKNVHQGPSATSISNPSKDIHRSTDQNQFVKHGVNASKSEPNISSENSTIYSSNMSLDIESAAAGKSFAVKDQLATGRGKRHPSKGNKSMGNNYDPELRNIVSSESAAADVNQIDRTISSKEGHSSGERTQSHWQPKSHTNSENNQNRGRLAGSETVSVEIDKAPKRDHRPQHKVHVPLHPDSNVREGNMANDPNVSHCEESVREKKPVPLKDVGHHQESIRERKPAPPVKGRPYLPSQVPPPGVGESAASNAAAEQEGNFSSAFRRNGNQNSRSGRGHESHGDWSSGHDSRQHSVPAFRERQRQNVHYEYQPVGHYKNSKMDKHMESGDGSTDGAPRYRERNQNHLKRDGGNFHRRQGGPAWVDSAHK